MMNKAVFPMVSGAVRFGGIRVTESLGPRLTRYTYEIFEKAQPDLAQDEVEWTRDISERRNCRARGRNIAAFCNDLAKGTDKADVMDGLTDLWHQLLNGANWKRLGFKVDNEKNYFQPDTVKERLAEESRTIATIAGRRYARQGQVGWGEYGLRPEKGTAARTIQHYAKGDDTHIPFKLSQIEALKDWITIEDKQTDKGRYVKFTLPYTSKLDPDLGTLSFQTQWLLYPELKPAPAQLSLFEGLNG